MKKFLGFWSKIPANFQNTLISTVVCSVLMLTGAPVETCQVIKQIMTQSPVASA